MLVSSHLPQPLAKLNEEKTLRRPIPPRTCEVCHQTYVPTSTSQKFCSKICSNKMKKFKVYTPQKQVEMLKEFYNGEVYVLDETTWIWRPMTEAEKQQRLEETLKTIPNV